jgi:hypothetical protein
VQNKICENVLRTFKHTNRYDEEEFAETPANNENMILLLLKKIHVNIKIDK